MNRTIATRSALILAGALTATGALGACTATAQGGTSATARPAVAPISTTTTASTGSVQTRTSTGSVATAVKAVSTASATRSTPSGALDRTSRVHASTPAAVSPAATTLRPGMKSAQVKALQDRLTALGYWMAKPDGSYGFTTSQAVLALQKAAGLQRDGIAGPATLTAARKGIRPAARIKSGHLIEINKAKQLILIVDGGKVSKIINTSTGNGKSYINEISKTRGVANTPSGSFRIQRQIAGLRHADLGTLYWPKYFNGGIAIHGSPSIPGYAASHGCARVSNAAMDWLWSSGVAPIGTRVVVY